MIPKGAVSYEPEPPKEANLAVCSNQVLRKEEKEEEEEEVV